MGHVYGWHHVPEAPERLLPRLHWHHAGINLTEVDHEPPVGVLDQENLFAQGIDTSQVVPGAPRVDALGSCTANATTAALSNLLPSKAFLEVTGCTTMQDTVAAERFAIRFYHSETTLMGQPWPPTDGGGSGQFILADLQAMRLASTDKVAHGALALASLLQTDGVLAGIPFLSAWEQPGSDGIVDGDGSAATLQAQIAEGVAGGHEIYLSGIPQLAVVHGEIDPANTIVKFRNSWSASWGVGGSGFFHLSTLAALGAAADFRQLVA